MSLTDETDSSAPQWLELCAVAGVDPHKRLQARLAVLSHPQALDCTLYRPDEDDLEAEEEELGDARICFTGAFQAPADWDAAQCEEYFDDCDPALFVNAYIECTAAAGSANFFMAGIGDHVAGITADGQVQMHFVHDYSDADEGRLYVLIRDDQPLF
jgi:hypothetical protein